MKLQHMLRQELAQARAVMLPPNGETCDELVYVTTETPETPCIATPDEHVPLGPAAMVAVTADGRWVWARAYRLPYEVQQRREQEERVRAEVEREAAVMLALDGLHLQVGGGTWPGSLRKVPVSVLRAMARAEGLRGSQRYALEYELQRWAEAQTEADGK